MNPLQDFVLPIILACVPITLNLVINKKVKKKDFVPCIIEIPKEILLLCMGFVVTYTAQSTNEVHATTGTIMIVVSFLLLIIVYALYVRSDELYTSLTGIEERDRIKVIFLLSIDVTASWIASGWFFYACLKRCLGGE